MFSTYPWLKSYISAQRSFLDCGGQIVRVFLFDPHWLSSNLEAAKRLLQNHDSLFAGTAVHVTTRAADRSAVARGTEDEFSILNQREVFLWERAGQGQPDVFSGGVYLTRAERVAEEVAAWNRLALNAEPAAPFFARVSKPARS